MKAKVERKPAARRLYIDTSAYLCMLLGEQGAERLSREMIGNQLLSSVLLVIETRRNLVRLARDGRLEQEQYKNSIERMEEDMTLFFLRDLTLDLGQSIVLPAVATQNSYFPIHAPSCLHPTVEGVEPVSKTATVWLAHSMRETKKGDRRPPSFPIRSDDGVMPKRPWRESETPQLLTGKDAQNKRAGFPMAMERRLQLKCSYLGDIKSVEVHHDHCGAATMRLSGPQGIENENVAPCPSFGSAHRRP